ncbi:MAG: putative DNA modification/repair radical SAM protein [Firmicutes bacterium]|nr:putative DNA modification/repair radical SAM protein [Bacillota bacterium]
MRKLKILADSAKYDVSCSSSGTARSGQKGKLGSAAEAGICHSWAADGRCISLLKILFTNKCVYDCEYCVNRRSGGTEKASFEPRELAELTMEFYRRNYIEGLFLSSAVEVSPDHTAEKIHEALWILREEFGFLGYIHAKIIPGVSPELVNAIGLLADRLSVNVELPSDESLALLAPQKKPKGIYLPMKQITETMAEQKTLKGGGNKFSTVKYRGQDLSYLNPQGGQLDPVKLAGADPTAVRAAGGLPVMAREEAARYGELRTYKEKFAPAGQTTQMIVGATPETDRHILKMSEGLYKTFFMKRVYFSAYIPVVQSPKLPDVFTAPPLAREHRLYQADWLLRFYGFEADEIVDEKHENLDMEVDPKVSWALRNIRLFPMEINKASMEELLRIPGIGNVSAMRIVRHRKMAAVKFDDLKKMGVVVKRAKYFITCCGKYYGDIDPEPERVRPLLGDGMIIPQGVRIKDDRADVIRGKLSDHRDGVQLSMFSGGFGTDGTEGGNVHGLSV